MIKPSDPEMSINLVVARLGDLPSWTVMSGKMGGGASLAVEHGESKMNVQSNAINTPRASLHKHIVIHVSLIC